MKNDSCKLIVGVIYDRRGDPPYVSVGKLWNETRKYISEKFKIKVLEVDTFDIENNDEYKEFVSDIDLLTMLSPYYSINRNKKKFPVVAYGLGSMQKGGHWLCDNLSSFKSYDTIILNSNSCLNIFNELVGNFSIEGHLMPFGVDTDIFFPMLNKNDLRKKYNVPEDAFILLYCGRINLQKNVLLLINLLWDLEKKHNNLYLMLIGSFDDFYIPDFIDRIDTNIKTVFDQMVSELNLKSKIIFFENQCDTKVYSEMINMADVGINLTTLISENFGYTPVEMQACGLPVIGTEWGGLKDTIIDGETGFHIQTFLSEFGVSINIEQAKSRIELLINNKSLLSRMKLNARKNVELKYTNKIFAENFQKIICNTYDNFLNKSELDCDFKLNPIMYNISYQIHKKYKNKRHVSWEHLHPEIDREHYNLIVSKCTTNISKISMWNVNSIISKGFDWYVLNGKLFSYDPRWNVLLEEKIDLQDDDIFFLELTDKNYEIKDMISEKLFNWKNILTKLSKLTQMGLLFPWENER